jgi:aspartate 1-decarboxylase
MTPAPAHCTMFRAKLHGLHVTQTELHYEGSITLDMDLVDAAGMFPYEQVHVLNENTGARFETYILPGERGSGTVCLNGPAARLAEVGDVVLVLTYALVPVDSAEGWEPRVVMIGDENDVREAKGPIRRPVAATA